MILLDTCTFLWITSNPDRLSSEAKKLVVKHAGNLFISAISAFEIGIKSRKGLIRLPMSADDWLPETLEFHGISEIPINSRTALQSTALPPLHRDPCDRIIIATAQICRLVLLTPDPSIQQYSGVDVKW